MRQLLFLSIFFTSCFGIKNKNDCNRLNVNVSETDTINPLEDSEYGIGDDDLFTGSELNYFYVQNKMQAAVQTLNDNNLQSCFSLASQVFDSSNYLNIVLDFSNLKKPTDTLIFLNELQFFNGDRKSLSSWQKSLKLKDIKLYYHNKCIGNVTLVNTFKMQWVQLEKSLPILGGTKDSIQLFFKNYYYQKSQFSTLVSLSEIGLSGIKNY